MNKAENDQIKKLSLRRRNLSLFVLVVVAWILFDIATKQYFDSTYEPGDLITAPILGLFQFRLVHNTGAAWGLFDQSTGILALVSLIVCLLLVGYFAVIFQRASIGEVFSLALVVAGGIGNGIDRFFSGYVVDFIEFTFIDFPVFNIADIGVTCGFALFVLNMLYLWSREDRKRKENEELRAAALGKENENDLAHHNQEGNLK